MSPAILASGGPAEAIPLWAVAPFAALLLAIALLPLVAHQFWESNRNRGLVAGLCAAPAAAWLLLGPASGGGWLAHAALEYVAFIALLASLYVIAGGIRLGGNLAGTPIVNTAVLGAGAVLASLIGTTGASMLLIRPLLRANRSRRRKTHVVVFFIFVVGNAGGLLTPLGDPPLFLGFLRGVPFAWTLTLALPWAFVVGVLLLVFHFLDEAILDREERERPGSQLEKVMTDAEPLRLEGGWNLPLLLGVVGLIVGMGTLGAGLRDEVRTALQAGGMVALALLSLKVTPKGLRARNGFTYAPIVEVALLFAGIFVTMVPALQLLDAWGRDGTLAIEGPARFFWATGLLSAFLDNAPTYVVFATIAKGTLGMHGTEGLGVLLSTPQGDMLLRAVSCGAVFMGAATYIGNGPNFMVKAIAEQAGVRMPSFFGFVVWSAAVLVPVMVATTFLFFR